MPVGTAGQSAPNAIAEADLADHRLNLEGYYVSIARRAVTRKKPSAGSIYSDPTTWTYSVLVIEDDPNIRGTLRFMLTHEKFEPRMAGNRNEIVIELQRVPSPDLILLDVNLPDANGFGMLARIRQHPALKAMPVIMLTAQANRQDVLHSGRVS